MNDGVIVSRQQWPELVCAIRNYYHVSLLSCPAVDRVRSRRRRWWSQVRIKGGGGGGNTRRQEVMKVVTLWVCNLLSPRGKQVALVAV